VFASHGFQNIIERVELGRFLFKKSDQKLEHLSVAERLRLAFEQLGPTFVKLGQLLATRPDLVPKEVVEEFKRFHDQVQPIEFRAVERVLNKAYGNYTKVFQEINETPLASASIAQVHEATLIGGHKVVIKVQRPGITQIIENDLNALYTIAGLLNRYIPEIRVFNPETIVDEFFSTLQLETNFIIEANNIRRFRQNFAHRPNIKIPHVFSEFSSAEVLVMEKIEGIPLSHLEGQEPAGFQPENVVKTGLRAFFQMVFEDRFFHGDLHAGNLFLLPDGRIGLIDFGVVGRLTERTRDSIADMLMGLAYEDYELFANTLVDIAPYSENIDPDKFAKQLRDLIGPYFGLSFKQVNLGRLLMDSTSVAAANGVQVPSDLMLFLKSMVTVEGMGRLIIDDFDLLQSSLEFAQDIAKTRYDPERITKDFVQIAKDSASLAAQLPRQLKQALRRWNNPSYAHKIRIEGFGDLKRTIETGSNLLFLSLIIGALIVGGSMTFSSPTAAGPFGVPWVSLIQFGLASGFGLVAFYNYIRK